MNRDALMAGLTYAIAGSTLLYLFMSGGLSLLIGGFVQGIRTQQPITAILGGQSPAPQTGFTPGLLSTAPPQHSLMPSRSA